MRILPAAQPPQGLRGLRPARGMRQADPPTWQVPEGRSLPPAFLWGRGPPPPPSCPLDAGPLTPLEAREHGLPIHGMWPCGEGLAPVPGGDSLKGGLHSPWHSLGVPLQGGPTPVLPGAFSLLPGVCPRPGAGVRVTHPCGEAACGQGGRKGLCGWVSFILAAAWSTHCVQGSARPRPAGGESSSLPIPTLSSLAQALAHSRDPENSSSIGWSGEDAFPFP